MNNEPRRAVAVVVADGECSRAAAPPQIQSLGDPGSAEVSCSAPYAQAPRVQRVSPEELPRHATRRLVRRAIPTARVWVQTAAWGR